MYLLNSQECSLSTSITFANKASSRAAPDQVKIIVPRSPGEKILVRKEGSDNENELDLATPGATVYAYEYAVPCLRVAKQNYLQAIVGHVAVST
jgi:hypothetical protein